MFRPKLPALAGYVEVEKDGKHYYKSIETNALFSVDEVLAIPTNEDDLAGMIVNLAYEVELLKLGVEESEVI